MDIANAFYSYFVFKFGNCGSLELHGFARNRTWTFDDNPPPLPSHESKGKSFVDLLLKSSEEDMKCWPHGYDLGCHKLKDYEPFSLLAWGKFQALANKMSNFISFEFRLRVTLLTNGDLMLISRVRNVNGKPFSFSFAYHTYLLVSDIRYG